MDKSSDVLWIELLPEAMKGGPMSQYQRKRKEQYSHAPIRRVPEISGPSSAPSPMSAGASRSSSSSGKAGGGGVHTEKFKRLAEKLKAEGRPDDSAFAIATKALGYEGSIRAGHRRKRGYAVGGMAAIVDSEPGAYTGDDGDKVVADKEVNEKTFVDHEGEYYVNAPMVNIIGGPDKVEQLMIEAAKKRVTQSQGNQAQIRSLKPILALEDGDKKTEPISNIRTSFQAGGEPGEDTDVDPVTGTGAGSTSSVLSSSLPPISGGNTDADLGIDILRSTAAGKSPVYESMLKSALEPAATRSATDVAETQMRANQLGLSPEATAAALATSERAGRLQEAQITKDISQQAMAQELPAAQALVTAAQTQQMQQRQHAQTRLDAAMAGGDEGEYRNAYRDLYGSEPDMALFRAGKASKLSDAFNAASNNLDATIVRFGDSTTIDQALPTLQSMWQAQHPGVPMDQAWATQTLQDYKDSYNPDKMWQKSLTMDAAVARLGGADAVNAYVSKVGGGAGFEGWKSDMNKLYQGAGTVWNPTTHTFKIDNDLFDSIFGQDAGADAGTDDVDAGGVAIKNESVYDNATGGYATYRDVDGEDTPITHINRETGETEKLKLSGTFMDNTHAFATTDSGATVIVNTATGETRDFVASDIGKLASNTTMLTKVATADTDGTLLNEYIKSLGTKTANSAVMTAYVDAGNATATAWVVNKVIADPVGNKDYANNENVKTALNSRAISKWNGTQAASVTYKFGDWKAKVASSTLKNVIIVPNSYWGADQNPGNKVGSVITINGRPAKVVSADYKYYTSPPGSKNERNWTIKLQYLDDGAFENAFTRQYA